MHVKLVEFNIILAMFKTAEFKGTCLLKHG